MLSAGGISVGLAASMFASRAGQSVLATEAPNIALLASLSSALLAATSIGALLPARRAAQIDPQQALRQD